MADDKNVIVLSSDEDDDQQSQELTEPEAKEEKLNLPELLKTPPLKSIKSEKSPAENGKQPKEYTQLVENEKPIDQKQKNPEEKSDLEDDDVRKRPRVEEKSPKCTPTIPAKKEQPKPKISSNPVRIAQTAPKNENPKPAAANALKNGKSAELEVARFRAFSDSYTIAFDKQSRVEGDYQAQFKCTYERCGKRLSSNVAFIQHVWAHIVMPNKIEKQQMDDNDGSRGKDNFDKLRTCKECLLVQPTPHRLQLHYQRVHKHVQQLPDALFLCNICECIIGKAKMEEHIASHYPLDEEILDLPYACGYTYRNKPCRFRSSNRSALIEHFNSEHLGTRALLCPFCLATFNAPPVDRKKKAVEMDAFVGHLMHHGKEKTLYCARCATRPCSQEEREHHIQQHDNEEKKVSKWEHRTQSIDKIKKQKSTISTGATSQNCIECGHIASRQHFSKNLRVCAECEYVSGCLIAFEKHSFFHCDGENRARWPLRKPNSAENNTFGCSKCQFITSVPQKMLHHQMSCVGAKIILISSEKMEEEAEQLAAIFGGNKHSIECIKTQQLKTSMSGTCTGTSSTNKYLSQKAKCSAARRKFQ